MAAQSMSAGSELLHRFLIDLIDVNQPKAFSSTSSQEADRIVGRYSTSRMNMPALIEISLASPLCNDVCSGCPLCLLPCLRRDICRAYRLGVAR